MKKQILSSILCALLLLGTFLSSSAQSIHEDINNNNLSSLETEVSTQSKDSVTSDLRATSPVLCKSYNLNSFSSFNISSSNKAYSVMQGGGYYGGYLYYVMAKENNTDGYCQLIKTKSGSVISEKNLYLGHGNDITTYGGNLYVANCKEVNNGTSTSSKIVTKLNPSSLAKIGTVQSSSNIYGIAYNQKKNKFVLGISGNTDNLGIADTSLNLNKTYSFSKQTGYSHQGIDCDDNYIFTIQSENSENKYALLKVYTWDGSFVCSFQLNTKISNSSYEAENICHVDTSLGLTLHMGFNKNNSSTDMVSKFNIIFGDANDDGKVSTADTLLIQKYVSHYDAPLNILAADVVDHDGVASVKDVLYIQKYLANLIDTLK